MDVDYLQKEVNRIVPSNLSFNLARIINCQEELHQTEVHLLDNRGETRKKEIIAGRTLSRRVAAVQGFGYITVQADEIGRPVWPSHLVGSISHKAAYVTVLLTTRNDYLSVGVDIEKLTRLSPDQYYPFASKNDIDEFAILDLDYGKLPSLVLSIKEAIFKCLMMAGIDESLNLKDIKPKLSVYSGVFNIHCEFVNNMVRGVIFVHYDCVISCVWLGNSH